MDKVVAHIVMGVDGMAKNINAISKFDIVRVVNEKSKKPDPRLLIPGGLTKIDMSSRIHQRSDINNTVRVSPLRARTLHRLYGDT